MENKYYVPSIEDFRVGFEFEHKDPYYEGREEFQEAVIETSELVRYYNSQDKLFNYWEAEHLLSNILWDIENKNIRVKYLDKNDIESFGFDCMRAELNMNNKHFFFKPWINIDGKNKTPVRCYTLQWTPEKNNIVIQTTDDVPSILFNGKVKNKSELKMVLQMIGVL